MNDLHTRLLAVIERDMERQFMECVTGLTCTNQVAEPQEPFNVEKAIREWDKLIHEARRTQVTFRVDLAHEGPMLKHETPSDGTVFEMSFSQAWEVHRHWPMRLNKVLNECAAEFVPGSQFDTFYPATLPMPPFDIPSEPARPAAKDEA